jgi:hypothetical protein
MTQITTTPEILKTSIELLEDYYIRIEKYHYYKLHSDIKKNIKHLKLMKISEDYRLKQ